MKKLFLGLLVFAGLFVSAQTETQLKQGTIVYADESVDLCKVNPTFCQGKTFAYLVQDVATGEVYETTPSTFILSLGAPVEFITRGRWDGNYSDGNQPRWGADGAFGSESEMAINTQSQTNNMLTNMQKARHDAMMATIQNAR